MNMCVCVCVCFPSSLLWYCFSVFASFLSLGLLSSAFCDCFSLLLSITLSQFLWYYLIWYDLCYNLILLYTWWYDICALECDIIDSAVDSHIWYHIISYYNIFIRKIELPSSVLPIMVTLILSAFFLKKELMSMQRIL